METSSSDHWNSRLRQERIRRNWRQQDLADQLGTTVVTVKRWERGSQQPSAYFRVKLCMVFEKSTEELFGKPTSQEQKISLLPPPQISQPDSNSKSETLAHTFTDATSTLSETPLQKTGNPATHSGSIPTNTPENGIFPSPQRHHRSKRPLVLMGILLVLLSLLVVSATPIINQFSHREVDQDQIWQTYKDAMDKRLLQEHLQTSQQNAPVRQAARADTSTVLKQLDEKRKGMLIQFLYQTRLIGYDIYNNENFPRGKPQQAQIIIDLSFADLQKVNLYGVFLEDANLPRTKLIGADLARADLTLANLTEADLTGANLHKTILEAARLSRSELKEANLTGADLIRADLDWSDLNEADLTGADLTGVNLAGADLTEADLTGAHLAGAHLNGVNLTEADLTGADLTGADLTEADLNGANLSNADLSKAKVTSAQLAEVCSLKNTRLPEGLSYSIPPYQERNTGRSCPIRQSLY